MASRPLIAVSPNALPPEDRRFYKGKALEYGEASLAGAVAEAGGIPVMVYRAEVDRASPALAEYAAEVIDGVGALVLSGGADIGPENYGEVAAHDAWRGDAQRDAWELALYRAAVAGGKPVLGVCRGAQLITVAEGGSLWQDLPSMRAGSLEHRSQEKYDTLGHGLELDEGTFLGEVFAGEAPLWVNSVHHQGTKAEAPGLRVLARAPDGVVEAFERKAAGPWVVGVQWHPEWMRARASARRLFARVVAEARR